MSDAEEIYTHTHAHARDAAGLIFQKTEKNQSKLAARPSVSATRPTVNVRQGGADRDLAQLRVGDLDDGPFLGPLQYHSQRLLRLEIGLRSRRRSSETEGTRA